MHYLDVIVLPTQVVDRLRRNDQDLGAVPVPDRQRKQREQKCTHHAEHQSADTCARLQEHTRHLAKAGPNREIGQEQAAIGEQRVQSSTA
jgi:hypothetical protein